MTDTGTSTSNRVFPCQSFARLPEPVRRTPAPMGMGGYVARQGHGSFCHSLRPQAFMSSELNLWRVAVGSCHTRWIRSILRQRTNLKTESRKRIIKKRGGTSGRVLPIVISRKISRFGGHFSFRPSINLRMTKEVLTYDSNMSLASALRRKYTKKYDYTRKILFICRDVSPMIRFLFPNFRDGICIVRP
jgi:hypothetical protein